MEKSQCLLTRLLHLFLLGFPLEEMLVCWQCSWMRPLKSRAGVGVTYLSRPRRSILPCCYLHCYCKAQGTPLKASAPLWVIPLGRKESSPPHTVLPMMRRVLSPASHRCVETEVLGVSVLRRGHSETAVEVVVSKHLLATSCLVTFLDVAPVPQWRSGRCLLAELR